MTLGITHLLLEPGSIPLRPLIGGLMIAGALALLSCALGSLLRRDRRSLGPVTRRLCRALGLSRAQRTLIDRLARGLGVPAPALLVSRGCFDAAAARSAAGAPAPAPAPAPERKRIAALRNRLFEGAQGWDAGAAPRT